MRPLAALLVSVPVAVAGWTSAHSAAYRFLDAEADHLHGYLRYAPPAVAALAAMLAVGLALAAAERRRGRLPAWPFALLAPVGFVVQEHAERTVSAGEVPFATAVEPTFLVGLVLQLPFALAAFLVARGLLTAAVAIGRVLGGGKRAPLATYELLAPPLVPASPRAAASACRHAARAPPSRPA
jgi:hypothetical protein